MVLVSGPLATVSDVLPNGKLAGKCGTEREVEIGGQNLYIKVYWLEVPKSNIIDVASRPTIV